ncbi:non-ribosomal peptide synthetase [Streptomyces sp. LX-29]|uniref:non-ribosomal peptide synthetase n=1 Tax=Streptomyces sp. LX-29 TaxID=2900152 RepID=UPI00240E74BB|nr:non-ribosomal peptide synthetase [Streptomyces sp. LX-29]WFB11202.1 non-ribosomal peptide synthetase [Streptomyces sp. LX-29]
MQPTSITSSYLTRFEALDRGAGAFDGTPLPVTGAQRRFVLAQRLHPQGRPTLVPLFFTFPAGTVDPERLHAAAGHLAATHPALRARPLVRRGVPVQVIGTPAAEVRRVRPRPGEGAADALLSALGDWPAAGPPLRLFLAADAETTGAGAGAAGAGAGAAGTGVETEAGDGGRGREILAIVMDHTVCDEQSLGQIMADLGAAYRDRLGPRDVSAETLADGVSAYAEAVRLQLAAEERASAAASLGYWAERLAALQPPSDPLPVQGAAPVSSGGPAVTGAAGRRLALGGDARAAAFPTVLDACVSAARTLHGRRSVPALGYPWGGRPAAAPPVLGCFLNTVPHPADDLDRTARASVWWDDLDHADAPFDEVVHAARRARVPWSGRLDGLVTFEDLHRRPPLRLGGVVGREIHLDGRPLQAPFAVSVSYGADLLVRMAWDRAVVPDHRAEDAFEALVAALGEHGDGAPERRDPAPRDDRAAPPSPSPGAAPAPASGREPDPSDPRTTAAPLAAAAPTRPN